MRAAIIPVSLFCCAVFYSQAASARLIESWPYKKLFEQSDLVVLVKPVEVTKADDSDLEHRWPSRLVAHNVRAKVVYTLKGKAGADEIKVLHFRWGESKKGHENDVVIIDGPKLVEFRTDGLKAKVGDKTVWLNAPTYMMFLKKMSDGRYEPISGRIDPALSVFEQQPASDNLWNNMDQPSTKRQ